MLSAPVLLCPLVSARGVRNLLKSLEFFDRRASRVGLITRRSQVQILAPLLKRLRGVSLRKLTPLFSFLGQSWANLERQP